MSEKTASKVRPLRLTVTSDKMNKSRTGTLERLVKHERYGKFLRKTTKFMFHDEKNESRAGDVVLVTPSRPLSARKKFTLLQVVKKFEE